MNDTDLRTAIRDLRPPRARAEFREQLRAEFTTPADGPRVVPAAPKRRFPLAWTLGAVAAAAVLAVLLLRPAPGPAWTVAPADAAVITVGGADTAGRITAGTRFRVEGDAWLDLVVENTVLCQVAPGSEVTVMRNPDDGLALRLHRGRLDGSTLQGFPAGGLLVRTDELETLVRGTTFGVLKGPDSTCVCVLEGSVRVRGGSVDDAVPAGATLALYTDGHVSRQLLPPPDAAHLGALRDR